MLDLSKTRADLLSENEELRAELKHLREIAQAREKLQDIRRLAETGKGALIENSQDAFITVSTDGRIMDANAAAETITGYSRSELVGSTVGRFIRDPALVTEMARRLSGETPLRNYQLNIEHRQGHAVPLLCNAIALRDADGQPCGWIASARDISDVKRWADKLRKNELRFHAIADSSNNWEYWLEANGSLAYVSPACQEMSGLSPEELSQNPGLLRSIIHPEDRDFFTRHHPEPADTGLHPPLEFRILSKTGKVHWILHHCQPVFGARGQFLGRRATNQDITNRKIFELEREHDEQRLKQLTQQLVTVQEAERRRISQDLHDDIGQAMTALILQLNTVCQILAPDQTEARNQLQEAIRVVEALMNQVRQLAYQLRPPALDSMPLAKALASLCSTFAQRSGMEVHFSTDPDLPPVPNIQATALYRLVQEGLTNTVKHARAASVWISLDYADGEICLSVEDNGEGFDPKDVSAGMGLQGIRDRFLILNGNLNIESAPGLGTHLYGSIPLTNHSL
jgi:PAS domain S-box-containing protein